MTNSTDLKLAPVSTNQASQAIAAQLLEQILDKSHPLLVEGLYLAALSPSYDTSLFKAMRARDDGRDEQLVARLARFSFIQPQEDDSRYAMMPTERDILLRRWIEIEPQAFATAHQRALDFWETHPHPEPFTQDQNRLYHLLVVNGRAGLEHLVSSFRAYAGERRLAATDRLLSTAAEIRPYLAAMKAAWLSDLDILLTYLKARLAQLRGKWQESLPVLKKLIHKAALSPQLTPYVTRAYGLALAETGQYVEAIEQYQSALEAFAQQPGEKTEQAFNMLNLGDAYVGLAVSARGYREIIPPRTGRWQRWVSGILSLRALLPLIVYLSFHFGLRVWRPGFWLMLQEIDWIIARLFVSGVRWYRQALQLLDRPDTRAGRVQAEEKLAQLYLIMGDADQAAVSFRALLEESKTPLSEYRRGSVQAGLGQALLRLGQLEAAQEQLEAALPIVRTYQDIELAAQVHGLLAEAFLQRKQPAKSLEQFSAAMRLYQKQKNIVSATEIAERLQELSQNQHLSSQERETASTTTQNITRRKYLRRFRHPALVTFKRVGLILLPVFILLIPMLSINIKGGAILTEPHFYPSPLTEPNPDYTPTLGQVVEHVIPVFKAEFVLWQVLALILFYLLAYTLIGVFVIVRTPLSTVQAAQSEAIHLDFQGLRSGLGETEQEVRWSEIHRIFSANIELFQSLMTENSSILLSSPQNKLIIRGSTAWYQALQKHIRAFSSPKTRFIDLGYRVLKSRPGGLYILSLLVLALFILLREWAPQLLNTNLAGTPYSLIDLYPYLYLGLFLPPLWWIVARPLYIQAHINPRSRLPWWAAGGGLLLVLVHWVLVSLIRLPLPNIYPSLAAFVLLGSSGVAIWKARHIRDEQPIYSLPARAASAIGIVAILILVSLELWSEVKAYHHLVVGNWQRDQGIQARAEERQAVAGWLLEKAISSYDSTLALSPGNETALNNRAAIQALLGRYEAATADYAAALQEARTPASIYASRAMAYEIWSMDLSAEGKTKEAQKKLALALTNFNRAIKLDPQNADYHIWRGVVRHARGWLDEALEDFEQAIELAPQNAHAFTGRGWVLFQQAEQLSDDAHQEENENRQSELDELAQETYQRALKSFQKAAEYEANSAEIWVAVGYGHFELAEYEKTMSAWEKAIELDPDNPLTIISHGMGHWLMADANRCFSSDATLAEKEEAATRLHLAIDDLNRALTLQPSDDWTYRVRAQIEYLLAFCPGHNYEEQLKASIASYDQALIYAPQRAFYWQFRARLGQALGKEIFLNEPEREAEAWVALAIAAADINKAYELDPEDAANLAWRDYITQEAWGRYHFTRGWNYYEAGDYLLAEADAEKAALFLPQDAEAAFNAGLVTLVQGKNQQAAAWYLEGLERATSIEESGAYIKTLQVGLNDLQAMLEAHQKLNWLGEPIVSLLEAEIAYAEGDYARAALEFERAASLRPQNAASSFQDGLIALFQGKSKQAAEHYIGGLKQILDRQDKARVRIVQKALNDLLAMQEANPELRWLAESILKELQSIVEALAPE
ncbi:MAG: hypothetical protein B6I34_06930 [Anaerolineaceae bacterium 4572_32.1]|nr:MAG: hypothetical protein B6I34_06930 [Anaerolineaceae bacterium 4572_32.1]